ncbi:uncharacterized protein LOC101222235 [Cucumis sativus]|uniref:Calmodulin-binding protein n=1 Tax=Cucumis sativus TaxID=3659 RepID=A0A0A0L082_CUCSA|nr:uncharacterized protein LOC101222235 [Cucumis sativus]KGN55168.1 hypothetical protein Csa_011938 [Cucumis sativus]
MEVAVPSPSRDYHFHGGRSRVSTIPTTNVFGNYFYSAPSSPMRMSEFDRGFNESQSSRKDEPEMEDEDFAFDICQQLEATTLSADELFDDGKIRPLETPPQSPISQQNKIFQNTYSTERRKGPTETINEKTERKKEQKRGRGRNPALSSSASRRAVRSLSPNRVSSSPWDEKQLRLTPGSPATGTNSNTTSSKGSRRWRLRDLFRSASEGRGTGKDPLRKYSTVHKKPEEVKHMSIKFNHSRNGPVSVYEPHFSLNKAASEDKKKTFLPYKGILGGLLFNPAAHMHTNFRSNR